MIAAPRHDWSYHTSPRQERCDYDSVYRWPRLRPADRLRVSAASAGADSRPPGPGVGRPGTPDALDRPSARGAEQDARRAVQDVSTCNPSKTTSTSVNSVALHASGPLAVACGGAPDARDWPAQPSLSLPFVGGGWAGGKLPPAGENIRQKLRNAHRNCWNCRPGGVIKCQDGEAVPVGIVGVSGAFARDERISCTGRNRDLKICGRGRFPPESRAGVNSAVRSTRLAPGADETDCRLLRLCLRCRTIFITIALRGRARCRIIVFQSILTSGLPRRAQRSEADGHCDWP